MSIIRAFEANVFEKTKVEFILKYLFWICISAKGNYSLFWSTKEIVGNPKKSQWQKAESKYLLKTAIAN